MCLFYDYRGIQLTLSKEKYELFKFNRGRDLTTVNIDQYLYNESGNKEDDEEKLKLQFTADEISRIVNDYLDIENKMWE